MPPGSLTGMDKHRLTFSARKARERRGKIGRGQTRTRACPTRLRQGWKHPVMAHCWGCLLATRKLVLGWEEWD